MNLNCPSEKIILLVIFILLFIEVWHYRYQNSTDLLLIMRIIINADFEELLHA